MVTVQLREEVTWLTDRRLWSRASATETLTCFKTSVKTTSPSPIIGEVPPLAVEIKG